ncbi:MAG: hypothetical protein B6U86_01325 [Candidatus Altiarchaeales archaeon ex4484_43]|nr:MAG: hypothetical protein B6U86_01325 [Candidatus Altiarchaeales archaeon ex4484_43]
MGFFKKMFRKKEKTKEELMKDVFEATKNVKVNMKLVEKQAKEHPDSMIFQNVKNPKEYQVRNHALYFSMQGDYNKSIEYANKGLKINPKSAYLYYIRGRSKGDIGLLKEGMNDLDKAIKIKPDFAEAFVERGYIKQKMGDFSSAKNDYEKGVHMDPSLQQQVNMYLDKEGIQQNMVIPSGVTFKFIVKPSLSENHQKGLRYGIIKQSGLHEYFKNIDVTFYDSYKEENVSNDKLKGEQILVKVFCPEPIISIEKDKEEDFYGQLKSKFSKWIIDVIQSNTEQRYIAKLEEFLYTHRLE